ncbi:hypothetical protein PDESU_00623 [Pontiella desulfatans]|uniref:Type II secretion system protein J n=1 Tax=Pontiella desulfatans TaxID=2750659 RepID=A0A6C2TWU7_PONDE|nr:prepilin-type N-terminal cleavage/methylation domain-containing protein [Pontiella desulfatans]VGO12073.1 hypothetical protein PDESU_00623 [Pontiella desulfatans]
MANANNRSGFTLMELVVSISILALMALMLAHIFSASDRAVNQGKDQAMLDDAARRLLDYVEQDIGQALIRSNVAFRVHQDDAALELDSLYFVSTGARRQLEGILRDTAPMRWKADAAGTWHHWLTIEAPYEGVDANTIDNVVRMSDYYHSAPGQKSIDFRAAHAMGGENGEITSTSIDYTQPLLGNIADHAVLTTFQIAVNGDDAWTGGSPDGLPDPDDLPRFVDVTIGLVPSTTMEKAMQLFNAATPLRGRDLVAENERVYSRRIFMPNRGVERLSY